MRKNKAVLLAATLSVGAMASFAVAADENERESEYDAFPDVEPAAVEQRAAVSDSEAPTSFAEALARSAEQADVVMTARISGARQAVESLPVIGTVQSTYVEVELIDALKGDSSGLSHEFMWRSRFEPVVGAEFLLLLGGNSTGELFVDDVYLLNADRNIDSDGDVVLVEEIMVGGVGGVQ